MISCGAVTKRYGNGYLALDAVDLAIEKGEIFALLGPNGAGKTTLIGVICGTVSMTSGSVRSPARRPSRLPAARAPSASSRRKSPSIFSPPSATVDSAGACLDARPIRLISSSCCATCRSGRSGSSRIIELSGGMKRRVMIAKALSHEPELLFLDEPTAGVDVNLRRDMWALVRRLRDKGVTIVLTTHYIEEAQEMADRVGVIDQGRILLVDNTAALMQKLGKRRLTLILKRPMAAIPAALGEWPLELQADGHQLVYTFKANADDTGIPGLLRRLGELDIDFKDLDTGEVRLKIFLSAWWSAPDADQSQRHLGDLPLRDGAHRCGPSGRASPPR